MSDLFRINGMIDPHTHLRDLDWAYKATFATETRAAVAGGYWAVFDMPNTPPNTVDADTFAHKRARLQTAAACDYGIYIGASQLDNSDMFAALAPTACGLKIFNNATTGDLLIEDQSLRRRMFQRWPAYRPIAVHAEEETVLDILTLVRETRKPTHFLHISTAREIAYLRAAKEEGLPVTLGVCPHHLYLTRHDEAALKGFARMKPTLKTPTDRDALWQAIADGLVDIIESDHAPHTRAEKESSQPPYGVPGLETNLPLMLTAVYERGLPIEQIAAMLSVNVQRIWGLTCPADTYTLIDHSATYTLDSRQMHSACGWSPFDGMRVYGRVRETRIRGQVVYDGEQVHPLAAPRNLFEEAA
jgi:dihydroorotase